MTNSKRLILLLKYFHSNKDLEIDSYDSRLQEILGIGQRQLARELEDLYENFDNIKVVKRGRKKVYKLITPLTILKEAFDNDYTLGMLFDMAQEHMPELFEEWSSFNNAQNKPYLFFNMPYEDIKELENNPNFYKLKRAIEDNREISFEIDDTNLEKEFNNVAPIKLIFSEGNWYISFVKDKNLIIRRVQFIKRVEVLNRKVLIEREKYLNWLKKYYQNPFTLYGVEFKKAILKAKRDIAIYFKPNMKKFFKSQKFIKEENKEIIFSIDYTQELEILPFIQRWLPHMDIIEPKELREAFYRKVKSCL